MFGTREASAGQSIPPQAQVQLRAATAHDGQNRVHCPNADASNHLAARSGARALRYSASFAARAMEWSAGRRPDACEAPSEQAGEARSRVPDSGLARPRRQARAPVVHGRGASRRSTGIVTLERDNALPVCMNIFLIWRLSSTRQKAGSATSRHPAACPVCTFLPPIREAAIRPGHCGDRRVIRRCAASP